MPLVNTVVKENIGTLINKHFGNWVTLREQNIFFEVNRRLWQEMPVWNLDMMFLPDTVAD